MGVVQIINNKAGVPFATVAEEGVKGLGETLAIAFSQRNKPVHQIKTKYDHLVSDAVISAPRNGTRDPAPRVARASI